MKQLRPFFAAIAAITLLLPVSNASAMMARGGEEFVLPEDVTVNDDLYVGAASAVVNGVVNGDLLIAGGNVTIANKVEGDLMAAGGNITINAEIGDDLRVVGGNVNILKSIGDDLVAAGGTVHVLKDVVVGGDLVVAGGLVILDGTVNGNVRVAGGEISLNGSVIGSIDVVAEDGLKVGPGARIEQRLKYSGYSEAEVADGAQVNQGVEFVKLERMQANVGREKKKIVGGALAGILGIAWILQVLMMLTAALVAIYGVNKFSVKLIDSAMKDVGGNMLRGFAFLILMPIAIFVIAATVLGIPLAILAGTVYALMIMLAKIFAGILLGMWIYKFASKEKVKLDWKVALVGVLAIEILTLIPFLGWLATFLVFCTVLGAIYSGSEKRIKDAR